MLLTIFTENDNVKVLGLAAIRKVALSDPTLTEDALILAQKVLSACLYSLHTYCNPLVHLLLVTSVVGNLPRTSCSTSRMSESDWSTQSCDLRL